MRLLRIHARLLLGRKNPCQTVIRANKKNQENSNEKAIQIIYLLFKNTPNTAWNLYVNTECICKDVLIVQIYERRKN